MEWILLFSCIAVILMLTGSVLMGTFETFYWLSENEVAAFWNMIATIIVFSALLVSAYWAGHHYIMWAIS